MQPGKPFSCSQVQYRNDLFMPVTLLSNVVLRTTSVDSLAWCSGHRAGKEIVRKLLGSVRVVNQQSFICFFFFFFSLCLHKNHLLKPLSVFLLLLFCFFFYVKSKVERGNRGMICSFIEIF